MLTTPKNEDLFARTIFMTIWKKAITLDELTKVSKNTMVEFVGIEYTEIGDNYLKGRMPVDHRTKQPYGILHGGASCVLAETLGSIAAHYCIESETHLCVGLSINTNHIRMAKSGYVHGIASPLHLGRSTQIWDIQIYNEEEALVSTTRLTLAILESTQKPFQ